MLKQIQSEAAAGGDNSPFLDDMASNIRPLRRRLRLTKGRLVGRMTQERQKLSFFIVIMFLVIFGLIVLAEVGYQVNIHSYLLNLRKNACFWPFYDVLGSKSTQKCPEWQKLFLIVIMFQVIFGLIVLAEVGYQVNIKNELLIFWVKHF